MAEEMAKAQAATTVGGSRESLPDFQPVAGLMVELQLSEQEQVQMREEIYRLQQNSLIIQVLGLRPNRQELRHLLQARLQAEIGRIEDVQFLGRGYYHVEFQDEASVQVLLAMKFVDIRGAWVKFQEWKHGFDPMRETQHDFLVITASFPGLPKECHHLLHQLGALIGVVLDAYIHNKDGKIFGIPTVKLLCTRGKPLPEYVKLPCLEIGGCGKRQKNLYVGLPNQCFVCKRMGHLAKECSLSRKEPRHVVNDEPQTSVGGTWVQVAKRHMIKKTSQDKIKWKPKDNIYNLLTNVEDGQTQMIEDLGNMDVPSNRRPGKEIVDGIQSRPDDPKLDIQVYNKEHHEGCSREMVLYAENAIVPISASETMDGQEIVGELQNKNQIVDIGFLPSFEGRWTRSMSKNLPKDHNPFMRDANDWRTFTKSLVEHFQGSDSRISSQRVHKQTNAFSKDHISFRRMIKSQDMSQEDRNRCLKERRLLSKFV